MVFLSGADVVFVWRNCCEAFVMVYRQGGDSSSPFSRWSSRVVPGHTQPTPGANAVVHCGFSHRRNQQVQSALEEVNSLPKRAVRDGAAFCGHCAEYGGRWLLRGRDWSLAARGPSDRRRCSLVGRGGAATRVLARAAAATMVAVRP